MDLNDPKDLSKFLGKLGALISIVHGIGLIIWGAGTLFGWGLVILGILGIIIAALLLGIIYEKFDYVPFNPIIFLVFAILLLTTAWIGGIIALIGAIISLNEEYFK